MAEPLKKIIPKAGTLVRRCGTDLLYRVTRRSQYGCHAVATENETAEVPGRKPVLVHGSLRRVTLAASIIDGKSILIDGRWRIWEVVP